MSKLTVAAIILMLVTICVTLSLVSAANAAPEYPEYDDPGIPWGLYQVQAITGARDGYDWTAVLCYPSAEVCNTRIRVYCLEPGQPSPAVGDWYERTGNQKFELRGYQTLRWYETIEHRWYAYLPSLRKCPPCPDCYDGAPIE